MVNQQKFAKRLKNVMDYYNLSAALFAEKIEVQRSSISHILSGRNKPSLEFVLKVLKSFPEVELYWLLNGIGKFPGNIKKDHSTPSVPLSEMVNENSDTRISSELTNEPPAEIEHIVVFFKDGTFKKYNP